MIELSPNKVFALKYSLAATLFFIANTAAAEKMNCSFTEYRYENNLFSSDRVFELTERQIEWRNFCYSSVYERHVSANYPLAVCKSFVKYSFILSSSPNKSDVGRESLLFWKNVTDPSGVWQEYDWRQKQPFDVNDTYKYFRDNSQDFDVNKSISWSTISRSVHTLNFDTKRQQFKFLYESTSIDGLTYEDSSVSTFHCE